MQVALSEQDYVRHFGSDSPLEIYLAYWKFDGGWESLWSYVLEKAGASVGLPPAIGPEDIENKDQTFQGIADALRRDAASEAVMSAKYNAGVTYGPTNGGTVVYSDELDGYCIQHASGAQEWLWSELIVDMQQVARVLVSVWWQAEG